MTIGLVVLMVVVFLVGAVIGLVPALTIYWLGKWWKNRPTRELCKCKNCNVVVFARLSDFEREERKQRRSQRGEVSLVRVSPVVFFGGSNRCPDDGVTGTMDQLDALMSACSVVDRKFYVPKHPLDTTVEILPFDKFYEMVTIKIHQRASAEDESILFHRGFDASGDRVDLPNT